MADAELEKTTITIELDNSKETFVAMGEVLVFDGFLKVYMESKDEEDEESSLNILPALKSGEKLEYKKIDCTERFTQRPARYTEASLVRKMEELGIGRPSTYAPTISTIQNREYVEKTDREGVKRDYNSLVLEKGIITEQVNEEVYGTEKSKLFPTDIGVVVNDYLVDNFQSIIDYNFTAQVEKDLDKIAEGEEQWESTIDNFYKDFHKTIEESSSKKTERKAGERLLGNDPKTGKPVYVKIGRFGVVAQMGDATDNDKPTFASLKAEQSLETITLEEALELFKLPRVLGELEGKEVKVAVGRFGPYIAYNGTFCSLPKTFDPLSVTLEEAEELLKAKQEAEANKVVKTFTEDPSMQLLNGRYGIYLCKDKTNYKLPKDCTPEALTYEDCVKIIEETPAKTSSKRGRKK
jgi:DNA topoisomerase-1